MSVLNVRNKYPYVIGLSGGIATGKSTVVNMLKKYDFKVFDSDLCVKKLWAESKELNEKVSKAFNLKLPIDKKEVSNIVFNDKNKLLELNNLIHPYVLEGMDKFLKDNSSEKYIVLDIPLLFEIDFRKCDLRVLVYSRKDIQLNRLMKRDNLTEEEALARIDSQMNINEKLFMADYVIYNELSEEELKNNVDKFLKDLGV